MNREKIISQAYELEDSINLLKRTGFNLKTKSKLKHAEMGFLFLLQSLNNGNPVTPSDIVKKLNVTFAAVTHHINSLHKHGYILRKESKNDRRVTLISLSKEGKELIKSIRKEKRENILKLIEFLGEEDTEKLISIMAKLNDYVKTEKERSPDA